MRRAFGFALACASVSAACFGSNMQAGERYSNGRHPRSDHALSLAAQDLDCPVTGLRVVAEAQRRYVNESGLRFVIEGCGVRATYVEQCDLANAPPGWVQVNDSLACGYWLIAKLALVPTPGPADGGTR